MSAVLEELDVVALEDEREEREEIRSSLHTFTKEPLLVGTYRDFVNIVRERSFDAVSIDWYLDDYQKGGEALRMLARQQPDAVRIVFTNDGDLIRRAADLADHVLLKADRGQYAATMHSAARLGRLRRVASEANRLGWHLPICRDDLSYPLREDLEGVVMNEAKALLVSASLAGKIPTGMQELLATRGFWTAFDVREYYLLAKPHKLRRLLRFARVSPVKLSEILRIDRRRAEFLLAEESDGDNDCLIESEDRLLSVLGFVLKMSNYEPELMPTFWESVGYFKNSEAAPPWDTIGLQNYLASSALGLNEALKWVRSH